MATGCEVENQIPGGLPLLPLGKSESHGKLLFEILEWNKLAPIP